MKRLKASKLLFVFYCRASFLSVVWSSCCFQHTSVDHLRLTWYQMQIKSKEFPGVLLFLQYTPEQYIADEIRHKTPAYFIAILILLLNSLLYSTTSLTFLFVGLLVDSSGVYKEEMEANCLRFALRGGALRPPIGNTPKFMFQYLYYKKLIRRWDSERELSFRRHCTRTKNTIDSCINSATDRFLQRRFTKFSEITQCNGNYAVQGNSRSPILVPIESSYTTSY